MSVENGANGSAAAAVAISEALGLIAHDAHDDTTEQTQDRLLAVQNDVDRLAAVLAAPVTLEAGLRVHCPGDPRAYRIERPVVNTAGTAPGSRYVSMLLASDGVEMLCDRGCGRVATSVIAGVAGRSFYDTLHLCEQHREEWEAEQADAIDVDVPVRLEDEVAALRRVVLALGSGRLKHAMAADLDLLRRAEAGRG